MKTARVFIVFGLFILALSGCSDPSGSAPGGGGQVHPQGWLNPTGANFHGDNYNAIGNTKALNSCTNCHGSELLGSGSVPGCDACHFNLTDFTVRVPGGSTWIHGTNPHSQFLAEGQACNSCHDALRQYPGQGPGNCHDCHALSMHPVGQEWLDSNSPAFHGLGAQTELDKCATCHGADFKGGVAGVSCDRCHFGPAGNKVPAGESWTHGTSPHSTTALTDTVAICTQCHSTSRLYGNGPNACHDCHVGATHSLGQAWLDPTSTTFHGTAAQADLNSCAACHGSDYLGGSSGVSCSKCHFGPDGIKVPVGESWTHGTLPHDTNALTDAQAICTQCHSTSRLYGNGPAACHDCHAGATHALGQAWVDKNSTGFHGIAATADVDSCRPCHGSDLQGGNSGISCSQCHFGPAGDRVPAGDNWVHGTASHQGLAASVTTCNSCHERNRLYGNGPNSCHDCHAGATHPLGQAWLDTASATFHGTAAQADIDSCAVCHGTDFLGGSAGVSCSRCHFDPAGSKNPPAESGWTHGTTPHSSANFTDASGVCDQCHTTSRLYSNGPAACHDCHVGATHPVGQSWLDVTSATFHGIAAQADIDSCAVCHGTDFLGGSAGISCSRCHFDPTGNKNPPAEGTWTHGSIPHNSANFTTASATCAQCHTTSRLYGNGPSACHDCHLGVTHSKGQAWLDISSATFHGNAAKADIDSCTQCHGSDYQGGVSGRSCSECHFGPTGSKNPPAEGTWTHGSIPHNSANFTDASAICAQCHTTSRLYGNGPTACHDCHLGVTHPKGQAWLDISSATFHGNAAKADMDSCKQCHGSDYQGGVSGRSCSECHFGPTGSKNPPAEGTWAHGSIPHNSANFTDASAICDQCHTTSRLYGNGPTACHDCHLGVTHSKGQAWLDIFSATFHGNAAKADMDSCKQCHGSDYQGGVSGRSCSECHFGPTGSKNPPAEGTWAHGSIPHNSANFTDASAICDQCHTTSRLYGNGPTACHDCHLGVTHSKGQAWLDISSATFHGNAAKADMDSCKQCHGSDYQGGVSGRSCSECHFGPTGSKNPPAEGTWAHGSIPHNSANFTDASAICAQCHTTSRLYGNGPTACHDCHLGVTHPKGQAWLDISSATFHGTAAKADMDSCTQCHGSDYQGGVSGRSCSECHFGPTGSKNPPAEGTWAHGTTPHNSTNFTDASGICDQCHTTSRLYSNGPAACHDCHTGATHPLGQAWLDVTHTTFHGIGALADIDSCAVCHGTDFQGGISGRSCSECHFGPTGSRIPPAEGTWMHGTTMHNSTNFTTASAICNQCHTTSRLYANGPNACHDCHVGATHSLGQTWLDPTSTTFHGTAAQADLNSCAACHGSDYLGGSSGVSCSKCHFGPDGIKVPVGESWTHGTLPHNTTALTDAQAICTQCHSISRPYGNGPAACHDCHAGATHALGQAWVDKNSTGFHGIAATADVDSCRPCHGSDLQGGNSGISCSQCHFGPAGDRVPAGDNWVHGTASHQGLAASVTTCNSCHERNRLYGNGPNSCHDCHAGATHPLGQAWLDTASATFHGTAAQADIDSCAVCHGTDFQGGSAGVSCSRCHFDPAGSKNPPAESGWTHGTTPHSSANFTDASGVCDQCHTTSRLYSNGPAACHDCHVGATHPVGQPWLDVSSATFHGTEALADIASCAVCHGADYQGGVSGRSCSECHFGPTGSKIPPAEGAWTHGSIPHNSANFTAASAICTQCHSSSRLYGNGPLSCHDCHLGVTHPKGQAWLDIASATFHGNAATADIDSCKQCHGSDYQGGVSGRSCSECHFGPTGSKIPPAEGTWTHGTIPHNSANFTAASAICIQCHTSSRLYGNGPSTCHDCHLGVTHPKGQAWLDTNSATFHGNAATADIDSCKQCHGADYLGGISGRSCSECHFGPTGSRIPPAEGAWTHGTIPHDSANFTTASAICNQCHDTNRLYGKGPQACHDCHLGLTHPKGQAWLDVNSATFHGNAFAADPDNCKQCHGTDYLGGISGRSCSECHFGPTGSKNPPAEGAWVHGTTPHSSANFTDATAICEQCHTTSRLYSNGPAACHDCHVGATHPLGQAWLDATSANFHGISAQADIDSCAVCHGSDFQGGSSGRSCSECHFGPTGSRIPPAEGAWTHGSIPHSSANFTTASAICNQCHTTSRLYGNGPNTCHDCHGSGAGVCADCHTTGVGGAPIVTGTSSHVSVTSGAGFGDCTDCHNGHSSSSGGVTIANNAAVGISYTQPGHSGIKLGGANTHSSINTITSEAEICWSCHSAGGVDWRNGGDFNGFSISARNWTAANFNAPGNAIPDRDVVSIHSVNSSAESSSVANNVDIAGRTSNHASFSGTFDLEAAGDIRCSYCHDVHDLNLASGDSSSGAPYLRGSWLSNPYPLERPPEAGDSYSGNNWGQRNNLPRLYADSAGSASVGGFFIDQNSNWPTRNGSSYMTVSATAGLCVLCHGSNTDSMDYYGGSSLWNGGNNGHRNSTLGGSGGAGNNLFDARRNTSGGSAYMQAQGASTISGSEWGNSSNRKKLMPDSNTFEGSKPAQSGTAPPRSTGWYNEGAAGTNSRGGSYSSWYGTGVADDGDGNTPNRAHNFSCSKCHSPHTSGLPALLITNCLDYRIGTWSATMNAKDTGNVTVGPTATDSWAEDLMGNCHRKESTTTGWNDLAPQQ